MGGPSRTPPSNFKRFHFKAYVPRVGGSPVAPFQAPFPRNEPETTVKGSKGPPDATMVADDAGRGIVALVQKAADLAKTDCNRAMDLAHRPSSELDLGPPCGVARL